MCEREILGLYRLSEGGEEYKARGKKGKRVIHPEMYWRSDLVNPARQGEIGEGGSGSLFG